MTRIVSIILTVVLTASLAFAAGSLWVRSEGATLKAEMKGSAKDVAVLDLNEELALLKQEGRWYLVRTAKGVEGWVYRGRVTDVKPKEKKKTSSAGVFGSRATQKQVSEASTDRAIRGLTPETQIYAQETRTPLQYQKALDTVLDRKFTAGEVEAFLKRGKVGEYSVQ